MNSSIMICIDIEIFNEAFLDFFFLALYYSTMAFFLGDSSHSWVFFALKLNQWQFHGN